MIKICVLYFLVGLIASTIGAISGIGGGVFIKPILDLLGHYDIATINFLSAATVFTMACVSLFKVKLVNIKSQGKVSLIIALGSIIGGLIGKSIFNYLLYFINSNSLISAIQSGILSVLIIAIFLLIRYKHKFKVHKIEGKLIIIIIGFGLGVISAFLGIGGGPLNIAILMFLFSMNAKSAAFNSILIIFFSQFASLSFLGISTSFIEVNMKMLPFILTGGALGGLVGTRMTKNIKSHQIEYILSVSLLIIFLINIYNLIQFIK